MGHLSTSFLWLHCVAFMLITRSQYSSVSKRKVQLNLGTPLHRISIGILFLTQFSPSGLSKGFPGFPGLLGFPPGFFALISGARLRPMKKSGTQAQPSPITVTLSPAWLYGPAVVVVGVVVTTVVAVGFGVVAGHSSFQFPTVSILEPLLDKSTRIVQPEEVSTTTLHFSIFFLWLHWVALNEVTSP